MGRDSQSALLTIKRKRGAVSEGAGETVLVSPIGDLRFFASMEQLSLFHTSSASLLLCGSVLLWAAISLSFVSKSSLY